MWNKQTQLHKAFEKGHYGMVNILLNKGTSINLCDENKEKTKEKASKWRHESTLQLFYFDRGADNNTVVFKETSLH